MEEETEWDEIIKKFGIKKGGTEEEGENEEEKAKNEVSKVSPKSLQKRQDLEVEEFDLDEDDEAVFREYREQRLAQFKAMGVRPCFREVREISGQDYVEQVTKAGDGVWVVLHLYKPGIPLCTLINNHLELLAPKFPETKFLKSVSSVCIPNFPDANLPAIFVYFEGGLKKQLIGSQTFGGMSLQLNELEWDLSRSGAFATELEVDPRKRRVKSSKSLFVSNASDDSD
jgi:hypothetical protein